MCITTDGYSTETVLFRWQTVAAEVSPNARKLPQFSMEEPTNHICDTAYAGGKLIITVAYLGYKQFYFLCRVHNIFYFVP